MRCGASDLTGEDVKEGNEKLKREMVVQHDQSMESRTVKPRNHLVAVDADDGHH